MGPSLSLCVPLGPRPMGSRCGGTQPVGGACITTAFSTEFSGSTRAMQVPESGGAPGVWLVRLVLAMFPCLLRPQDTALLATLFPLGFACAAPSTYCAVPSALDWPAPHIPGASAWGTVERQDAQQGRETLASPGTQTWLCQEPTSHFGAAVQSVRHGQKPSHWSLAGEHGVMRRATGTALAETKARHTVSALTLVHP